MDTICGAVITGVVVPNEYTICGAVITGVVVPN